MSHGQLRKTNSAIEMMAYEPSFFSEVVVVREREGERDEQRVDFHRRRRLPTTIIAVDSAATTNEREGGRRVRERESERESAQTPNNNNGMIVGVRIRGGDIQQSKA